MLRSKAAKRGRCVCRSASTDWLHLAGLAAAEAEARPRSVGSVERVEIGAGRSEFINGRTPPALAEAEPRMPAQEPPVRGWISVRNEVRR